MVVGFNHNFSYKGQIYHVQTEDSGIKNPHIITLLYRGGTILSSKKTSYADIVKVDHLESVVEDLMKGQHREMLRQLKNGEFDELLGLSAVTPRVAVKPDTVPPPSAEKRPSPATPPTMNAPPQRVSLSHPRATPSAPSVRTAEVPPLPPTEKTTEVTQPDRQPPPAALTLDDIILSYMVGEDRK